MSIPNEVLVAVGRAVSSKAPLYHEVVAELEKLGTITVTPHPRPPKTGLRFVPECSEAYWQAARIPPIVHGEYTFSTSGILVAAHVMLEDLIERSRVDNIAGLVALESEVEGGAWFSERLIRRWLGLPPKQ